MAVATMDEALDMTTPLKKKAQIVAALDMPGIPAGTKGRVTFVAGFDWIRYWVRWENGVTRGSMNRATLVRPGEPYGEELAAILAAAAAAPTAESVVDGGSAGGGEAGSTDGGVTVAGVHIPAHLLDRSKQRRQLLGG